MLVTVENGKATKVRGDPDHPFTQGGLCVKVNAYTEHGGLVEVTPADGG